MQFDGTINLGHIISLLATLIVFITWAQNIKWSVVNLDNRIKTLEKSQEELTKLIIANAVMNTNIMSLTDRLANLERRLIESESKRHHELRT